MSDENQAMTTENQVLDLTEFQLKPGTTLVEASAGTGKTYTIKYIVLDLLLKGLSISEILVVTFTEAATKELKDRLQSFLFTEVEPELAGSSPSTDAALRSVLDRAIVAQGEPAVKHCIRKAMLEIDQAPVYTIHGFCQRALQENAFAADANFDSEICADVTSVVEELVMDFLRRAALELPVALPKLPGDGNTDLEKLCKRAKKLTSMLRIENPYRGTLSDVGGELHKAALHVQSFAAESDEIVREFMSYEGKLNGRSYSKPFFSGFEALLIRVFRDPFPESLAKDLKKLGSLNFNGSYKETEVQSGFFAACEALSAAKEGYGKTFLRCFDTWFIDAYQKVKQERGFMTYDDMILDLERAVRQSERLRSQLRTRYRAALVDEFQDTDDRQYAIFKTLFAPAQSTEREHYFAMIGDPKQSIYAFRGADISAYLEARRDADERYTLPMNFRSEAAMVAATNAFFEGGDLGSVIPGTEANSIAFEKVKAADKTEKRLVFCGDDQPGRLYERGLDDPGDGKIKTAHESSAKVMVSDVERLLKLSSEGKVYFEFESDGTLKRREPVHAGDIAVLVNSNKEAAKIQRAFQRLGILAVRAKTGSILASDEAKDFIYFLMACLNPRERYINYLLVSALYGKNDAEMKALPDQERSAAYELFTRLGKEWREGASLSSVWMEFLNSLRVRETLLAKRDGERRLTNYMHISEYAQELERTEGLSPERLVDRMVEVQQESEDTYGNDENLVRLESDGRAVKIMTMHSSKGLEFPIVFLPDLWQKGIYSKAKSELLIQRAENDLDCLSDFKADSGKVIAQTSAENLRLGYVAMTRAVHFCVYYNVRDLPLPSGKGSGNSSHKHGWFDQWLLKQRGGTYPAEAAAGFLPDLDAAQSVELDPPKPEREVQQHKLVRAISSSYTITSYSALARSESTADGGKDPSEKPGTDEALEAVESAAVTPVVADPADKIDLLLGEFPPGAQAGTCIHEVLERCDFTQPANWPHVAKAVIERNFPDGGDEALNRRIKQTVDLIERLTKTPRSSREGHAIDLSKLRPSACIPELEFYFPIRQVDVTRLEQVIQSWAERVGLEYEPANYKQLSMDGFLTGFVDLFFTQGGRYYIMDWKSNKPLANHVKMQRSYDREGMHEHMCHSRYYMQALIYSVATSAYLRQRLGARFDWDTHVGGFIYCFLRGVGNGTGWLHESFSEAEVLAAAEALGQTTHQEGVA